MNEVKIVIRENSEVAVEDSINGITSYKRINLDDLTKCLNQSLSRGGICSGLLPNGCLSFSYSDDGTAGITLLFPDNRADISYYQTHYPGFPLPKLVFGFSVSSEGRISSCRLGVTADDSMLKPDTKMFRYPFSNVSGFHLCTGNNALPKCKSFHTLGSLARFILSMPNNDDYFKPENNKSGLGMRDLLEHLKDKAPEYYYTDILVPFNGMTLNDFVNGKSAY